MEEVFALVKSGWTPGAVGIWTLVLMCAGLFWKGLPGVLDAWTRRADAEAAKAANEFTRLQGQIALSDARHEACERRFEEYQRTTQVELDRQNNMINGLLRQMRQMQISGLRTGTMEPTNVTATLIANLDKLPIGDLPNENLE